MNTIILLATGFLLGQFWPQIWVGVVKVIEWWKNRKTTPPSPPLAIT